MRLKMSWVIGVILLLVCYSVLSPSSTLAAGQFTSGSYGGKTYKLYIPEQYDQNQSYPLYVMLHGCTQDANQFATSTQMNALADEKGFLVLYPEQNSSANSSKCWNWFEPSHQSRGSGEPGVIAGMVQEIQTNYTIQQNQVYVAGLSAGAAMSVIMGATYPDIFSGVGVGAGLEYKAATTSSSAFSAMSSGGPDPTLQGRAAYSAMGSHAELLPVIVFHGTSDYTVRPVNGDQVISQWAVTNDLSATGTEDEWIDDVPENTENLQVPGGRSYTLSDYHGQDGKVWMKKVIVESMGHAWSGGSSQGSYTDPQGPNASRMMWEFFNANEPTDPSDPNAPVTTASPSGGTYQDSVSVELSSNELVTTYYTIDGTIPTQSSQVYSSPIKITKDTTLKFFSVDSNGNAEKVKTENYLIETSIPNDPTTIVSIGNEDGFVGQYTADGKGTSSVKVGDKGMYNTDTYRGLLSFDTSGIAETIQSAKIRLYVKSKQGNIANLQLDVKKGTFGSNSSIEQADYGSAPTQSTITSFAPPSGDYIDIELPTSSLSSINSNGLTQFRLKATTTAGFNANVIEFYGGESVGYEPTLILN
ncbi:extracellular catalytic domain type 1 short-chain-length polyhydroxyalkanoate depolymerase [Alkalihalobacillus sp. CinArs1]|uniref:extracellular catalytic domain type 1 short-chain-length polyhydroxyalkanoate depolymerase n=1 Tax=Alkalihalobacillus sp. CinArs1 TaxID=2995314 RepID=UPI0022DDF1FC|nr:PHB depolymerase family esterase [Alkalihalobacillus sp. CinArs1]